MIADLLPRFADPNLAVRGKALSCIETFIALVAEAGEAEGSIRNGKKSIKVTRAAIEAVRGSQVRIIVSVSLFFAN